MLRTSITTVATNFLYECIFTRFGCPLTIVIDQGVHFINGVIKNLIDNFLLKHVNSITYYPQGNGQTKSTNKVLGTLLTKLVNENKMDWDEHLPIILFFYRITFKVAIGYTPYQLVYGLHLLIPVEYIPLVIGNDHIKGNLVRVLTSRVLELEKLEKTYYNLR